MELPDLNESLENKEGWNKVEGVFINLVINKLPMISKDLVISTDFDMEDDKFEVSYILKEMGRSNVFKYLINLDSKANSLKYTKHFKAKAIRFVPDVSHK